MTKFEELKIMNEVMLEALRNKGEKLDEQLLISKILEDDRCFFKMSKEDAFMLLEKLDIIEKEKVYNELVK